MTTLDRMFFVAYLRSYLIVLSCLVGLYVVIDLFTHLDDFVNKPGGFIKSARHIAVYYGTRIPELFDLLGNFVTLIAAVFTASWMLRNNELLPQLSAGIPTRRAIRPLLMGCALTLALGPLNQEYVLPEVADQLTGQRDDPDGAKAQSLLGAFDASGIHIEGFAGFRKDRKVDRVSLTFPESSPSGMVHMTAEEGVFVPKQGDDPLTGGWLLTRAEPKVFDGPLPINVTVLGTGRYFLKVTDADYDAVCRGGAWYVHASTTRLREMLADPEPRRRGKMAVLFHARVTKPLVGAVMAFMGLAIILANPNRHVFVSAGLCLAATAALFLFALACKYLGDQDVLPPTLSAWLPVVFFGPVAVVAFDAVHT